MKHTIPGSLLFIALLAGAVALLLAAACGGGGEVVIDPNATPSAQLRIVAKNTKWDADYLVAPAGQAFTVVLDNQDSGTLHNFAVYREKGGKGMVFRGETFEGKKTLDNNISALPAGQYYYRCDVHPEMAGILVVK